MIPLPEISPSDPQILASWLELTALSEDDGAVFRGTVAESLRDSNLFEDTEPGDPDAKIESEVARLVRETWAVLLNRQRLLGDASPFVLEHASLTRRPTHSRLPEVAGYTALLLLEAAVEGWFKALTVEPGDPGRAWFEEITEASLRGLTSGQVVRFGAPFPPDAPQRFGARVQWLAKKLSLDARPADLKKYAGAHDQDGGLDVVARWRIADENGAVPYFLVQCATGEKWIKHKRAEPPMSEWNSYVDWDGPTLKSLAVPFTLRRKRELAHACFKTERSMIFDRLRLSAGNPDKLIGDELRTSLVDWCRVRFALLSASS